MPVTEAVGLISAEIVCPYPPGIPLLVPGERITKEVLDYLGFLRDLGNTINGQDDKTLHTIKVVCEKKINGGETQSLFDSEKIVELKR